MSIPSEVLPKPVEEVITLLEGLLKSARAGEIRSIACALTYPNACTGNCFSLEDRAMALIGELRVLEREIIDLRVQTRRKVAWWAVEEDV